MTPATKQTRLEDLPEELHLLILSFLDSEPPSLVQFWSEPSLKICSEESTTTPIKNLSLVSRSWRRITLPVLLSCLQIHLDLGRARLRLANGRKDAYQQCLQDSIISAKRLISLSTRSTKVYSVTIIADSIINDGLDEIGEIVCVTQLIRSYFREFLGTLFTWLDPTVMNIVAVPLDMALFTDTQLQDNSHQPLLPAELAMLHLRQEPSKHAGVLKTAATENDPAQSGGVLSMRQWSHLGFNVSCIPMPGERRWTDRPSLIGRTLVKHIHKQYQELRAPQPVVLKKLLICVNRCPSFSQHVHSVMSLTESLELADTESVCYSATDGWTAIQPARALSGSVQFIYEHTVRMVQGRRVEIRNADGTIEHCWKVPDQFMRLKEIVVHDIHSPDRAPFIDELFTGLHLPVWAEYERGVFTRLLKLPADG